MLLRGGIAIAVFVLAGWIGYGTAPRVADSPRSTTASGISPGDPPLARSSESKTPRPDSTFSARSSKRSDESPEARARRITAVKQRIKDLWTQAPELSLNWELQAETHRLLAGLEAEELGTFFTELPPMGNGTAHLLLRLEVVKEWAAKDGPAAIAGCAVGNRIDSLCRANAIGAWGEVDPAGALAFLRREDLPPAIAEHRRVMRWRLLDDIGKSDLALAERELPYLKEDERKSMLATLVTKAAGQDEIRERLLAMARESTPEGKASQAEEFLLRDIAEKDPQAALDRIGTAENLDPEERKRLDFTVLSGQANHAPVAAFEDWLARNPGQDSLPEGAWNTLASAMNDHGPEMIAWFERMPAGGLRDQFQERGARSLAKNQLFDDAIRLTGSIADPALRTSSLRSLRDFWNNADPAAAAKWVESLPGTDRSLLGE
ncbi:hypothetical protein [Luteolibacter sp. Populi]|uniref:hypothetical protein n=1 Tax=Luteolibacter sp. Populi TaxID=3230487 RepID=UPI003467AD96